MVDLKEKSAALSSALNLGEMHQKHIQCSKQLSNNATQISNTGKQHPEESSEFSLSLHRSSRRVWQNFSELPPTTNEASLQITGRLDLSDKEPANFKGRLAHVVALSEICTSGPHRPAESVAIFGHQKPGCGPPPLVLA
jgi:hypothetical protein